MVIVDDQGVTACRLDDDTEEMAVAAVLSSHVAEGAEAAAFVTVTAGFVLAQILIAEPRNEDVRRAPVSHPGGQLLIGPWVAV